MKCRNCGTENPDHAKFCNECGAKLRPAISLKKDDPPPAFIDRTYTRDSDRPVPAPDPVAESPAPTVEPEQTPPSAGAPVFFPSSTPNHDSADLPRSAFSEPPVTGRKTAVPDVLPNPRLAWGEEEDEDEEEDPWYENTWVCIAALFLLFPLGVFLLWKFHKDWGHTVNTVITCSFGAIFAAIILSWSTACFIDYMDSLVIRPEQLQILNGPLTLNLNESEYIDFKITPQNASIDDVQFSAINDNVLLLEQFIDDGKLRGKITATHTGSAYIYLYADGKLSNSVQISVIDTAEYQTRADWFSEKIEGIGTVTLDKADQINHLLREYNSLPSHIKELVQNAEVLMEANRTLEQLEKEEAERLEQMILDAEAAIEQIGEVTLEKQDLIAETRQQVNAIPWQRRKNMVHYDKLTEAEAIIKELQLKEDIIKQSEPITPAFYSQYLRNPDVYQGRFTSFRCKVFQIAEETKAANFYLAHLYDGNEPTDMVFYFICTLQDEPRIWEGDIVTVYGSYNGVVQYFTSETTTASVPQVRVRLLDTE